MPFWIFFFACTWASFPLFFILKTTFPRVWSPLKVVSLPGSRAWNIGLFSYLLGAEALLELSVSPLFWWRPHAFALVPNCKSAPVFFLYFYLFSDRIKFFCLRPLPYHKIVFVSGLEPFSDFSRAPVFLFVVLIVLGQMFLAALRRTSISWFQPSPTA